MSLTAPEGTVPVADCTTRSARDSSVTMFFIDACMDAARTEAAPTSDMPIMSAPAVLAVRRGLRVTLPRASVPRAWPTRRTGRT